MSTATSTTEATALLTVKQTAEVIQCSPRQVFRLSDARLMPAPLRIGRLVRWERSALDEWIAAGCPSCR